jgi:3-deoxy-D-manno-octulosonic-acid transferase
MRAIIAEEERRSRRGDTRRVALVYSLAYTVVCRLLAPLLVGNWLLRGWHERGYWAHLGERFGFAAPLAPGSLWLHAVSAGEVQAAAPLVRALLRAEPQLRLLVTTATPAGRARAAALYPAADIRYLPIDVPGCVRRFLARTRPRAGVILETELWPALYAGARGAGIPLVLASARLSARSVRRYGRVAAFARKVLAGVSIGAQSDADAARFLAIGADPGRLEVTGNLKFDYEPHAGLAAAAAAWRVALGADRPVWVAGSTHAVEEDAVLDAHRRLLERFPDALLVLVPRHPPRFAEVEQALGATGLEFVVRRGPGALPDGSRTAKVLLLATLGELEIAYAAADAAFVGGTLVPVGGHNLIEPAAAGRPVLFGPWHANALVMAELLRQARAGAEVADATALGEALLNWFAQPDERLAAGARGAAALAAGRGAASRTAALVLRALAGGSD